MRRLSAASLCSRSDGLRRSLSAAPRRAIAARCPVRGPRFALVGLGCRCLAFVLAAAPFSLRLALVLLGFIFLTP
eukprot:10175532-Alexandrium_andersonii.AAC.1